MVAPTEGPWAVSTNCPVLIVKPLGGDMVRNMAMFYCGRSLKSPEGVQAQADALLGASAPDLAKALVAAVAALRSYQFGNGAPDLARSIADHGEAALRAAGVEVIG